MHGTELSSASVSPLPSPSQRPKALKKKRRKQSRESSFQERRRKRLKKGKAGALQVSEASNRLKSMAFPSETLATDADFFSNGSSRVRSSQLNLIQDLLNRKGMKNTKSTNSIDIAGHVGMDLWVSSEEQRRDRDRMHPQC